MWPRCKWGNAKEKQLFQVARQVMAESLMPSLFKHQVSHKPVMTRPVQKEHSKFAKNVTLGHDFVLFPWQMGGHNFCSRITYRVVVNLKQIGRWSRVSLFRSKVFLHRSKAWGVVPVFLLVFGTIFATIRNSVVVVGSGRWCQLKILIMYIKHVIKHSTNADSFRALHPLSHYRYYNFLDVVQSKPTHTAKITAFRGFPWWKNSHNFLSNV